jgi:DNA ligase-1
MKYLNQAPKELKAMSAAFKKAHKTVQEVAQTGRYYIEPKYDGVHGIAIIGPAGGEMLSRDNKKYLSCNHILKALHSMLGPGWVVFGEIYKWGTPFKEISGAARRHSPQPDLMYVVYDMIKLEEWEANLSADSYEYRRNRLRSKWVSGSHGLILGPYHDAWGVDPDAYAGDLKKQGGYDGAILKDSTAGWAPGACKQGECIKIKPQTTLDLRVVGMEEGKGKHAGTMGALQVVYKGVVSSVGTGFTDEERGRWWSIRHVDFASSLNHYIVEVKCMEIDESNTLREPVFLAERFDKVKPD